MPFGWGAARSNNQISDPQPRKRGEGGLVEEAKKVEAWPSYEAEWLKKRLQNAANNPKSKYNTAGLDDGAERYTYLDKVSADYREEADAALKAEFVQFLHSKHEVNLKEDMKVYVNDGTKPRRMEILRGQNTQIGNTKNDWQIAPWGKKPLYHLRGVRDFLCEMDEKAAKDELDMNILAEYGPQSLEEAWMYFKHWVKGRPVALEESPFDYSTRAGPYRDQYTHFPDEVDTLKGALPPSDTGPDTAPTNPNPQTRPATPNTGYASSSAGASSAPPTPMQQDQSSAPATPQRPPVQRFATESPVDQLLRATPPVQPVNQSLLPTVQEEVEQVVPPPQSAMYEADPMDTVQEAQKRAREQVMDEPRSDPAKRFEVGGVTLNDTAQAFADRLVNAGYDRYAAANAAFAREIVRQNMTDSARDEISLLTLSMQEIAAAGEARQRRLRNQVLQVAKDAKQYERMLSEQKVADFAGPVERETTMATIDPVTKQPDGGRTLNYDTLGIKVRYLQPSQATASHSEVSPRGDYVDIRNLDLPELNKFIIGTERILADLQSRPAHSGDDDYIISLNAQLSEAYEFQSMLQYYTSQNTQAQFKVLDMMQEDARRQYTAAAKDFMTTIQKTPMFSMIMDASNTRDGYVAFQNFDPSNKAFKHSDMFTLNRVLDNLPEGMDVPGAVKLRHEEIADLRNKLIAAQSNFNPKYNTSARDTIQRGIEALDAADKQLYNTLGEDAARQVQQGLGEEANLEAVLGLHLHYLDYLWEQGGIKTRAEFENVIDGLAVNHIRVEDRARYKQEIELYFEYRMEGDDQRREVLLKRYNDAYAASAAKHTHTKMQYEKLRDMIERHASTLTRREVGGLDDEVLDAIFPNREEAFFSDELLGMTGRGWIDSYPGERNDYAQFRKRMIASIKGSVARVSKMGTVSNPRNHLIEVLRDDMKSQGGDVRTKKRGSGTVEDAEIQRIADRLLSRGGVTGLIADLDTNDVKAFYQAVDFSSMLHFYSKKRRS